MNIIEFIPGRLYGGGTLDHSGWRFISKHVNVILSVRTVPDYPPVGLEDRLRLWFPIQDKIAPDLSWVIYVMNCMNTILDSGNDLYVHDTAGINRLGFILTAFYMQRFSICLDEALFTLRLKKSDLLPKPWYMALLYQYQNYLFCKSNWRCDDFGSC